MFAADTSLAVPSIDPDHPHYAVAAAAVVERRPVLAGHAAFESLSVLTRLPAAKRLSPRDAATALARSFGDPCWVTAEGSDRIFRLIAERDLAGGAVYDAIVAQAALDNERTLLTLDRRAQRTYDAVGVRYELLI